MVMFELHVEGYPPAKNEALSMLSVGHSHAPRVRALLEAARQALVAGGGQPISGPVGLDVVVYAPSMSDPWDATNYLGGIADVLEDKAKRGTLDHLIDLVGVYLYANDRQIREVHYRQVPSTTPRYRVCVWPLDEPVSRQSGSDMAQEARGPRERLSREELLQRITYNPDILGGKPTIRGRRLAVEHVLGMLAAGDTPGLILSGYDWLEHEDILACLAYAYSVVANERFMPTFADGPR